MTSFKQKEARLTTTLAVSVPILQLRVVADLLGQHQKKAFKARQLRLGAVLRHT